jgi:hypothetical protein
LTTANGTSYAIKENTPSEIPESTIFKMNVINHYDKFEDLVCSVVCDDENHQGNRVLDQNTAVWACDYCKNIICQKCYERHANIMSRAV